MSKNEFAETISPHEALKKIEKHKNESNLVILDIRPRADFETEHVPGAVNIDYDGYEFKKKIGNIDKGKNYIIYCKSGVKGEYFMEIMNELGFPRIYNISGGFAGWKKNKLPLTKYF
jgi:rhodanese-related sulfurtransferase